MGTYIDRVINNTIRTQIKNKTYTVSDAEIDDIFQQTWLYILNAKQKNEFLKTAYDAFIDKDKVDFREDEELKMKYKYLQMTILSGVQKSIAKVKGLLPTKYKKNDDTGKYEIIKDSKRIGEDGQEEEYNKKLFKLDIVDINGDIENISDNINYNKNIMVDTFYQEFSKIVTAAMLMSSDETYKEVKAFLRSNNFNRKSTVVNRFLRSVIELVLSIETSKEGFSTEDASIIWEQICSRKNNGKLLDTKLFKQFVDIVKNTK